MRDIFVCLGVWLLAVSPASGQFTILSDERSIEGHAQWSSYIQFYGPINATYDERVVAAFMEPLSVRLTAAAVATPEVPPDLPPGFPLPPFYGPAHTTAWHDSRVSVSEIFLSGGTDEPSGGTDAQSSAQTSARVTFELAAPTTIDLQYERIDAGTTGPIQFLRHSGDASIFITGPSLNLSIPAHTLADWDERGSPFPPVIGHEFLTLAAGIYEINASVTAASTGWPAQELPQPEPASFMVRLSATPIPEPSTYALATVVILGFWLYRRHQACHFGK